MSSSAALAPEGLTSAAALHVEAGGRAVAVEVVGAGTTVSAAWLAEVLRDLIVPTEQGTAPVPRIRLERAEPVWAPHPWRVAVDGVPRGHAVSEAGVLAYLGWELGRIAAHHRAAVALTGVGLAHAGRGVALLGNPRHIEGQLPVLAAAGWGYVSGREVLVQPGRPPVLHHLWTPVTPSSGADDLPVPASSVLPLAGPAPVVAVVVLGGSETPHRLPPADALVRACPGLSSRGDDGAAAFAALAEVLESVPAFAAGIDAPSSPSVLVELLDEVA